LESALNKLEPGTISDPIQSGSRIYIMGLRSRRLAQVGDPLDTRLAFLDVIFPAEKSAPLAILSTAHLKADQAAKDISSCTDAPRIAAENGGVISGDMVQARAGDLRDASMRKTLMEIDVGHAAQPLQLPNGFHVLVLCGRQSPQGGIPTREEVEARLIDQQLELKARRYLRDLQRDAAIDIK
jgi:peptidyl-prolyl cis-trans isomerase SurA